MLTLQQQQQQLAARSWNAAGGPPSSPSATHSNPLGGGGGGGSGGLLSYPSGGGGHALGTIPGTLAHSMPRRPSLSYPPPPQRPFIPMPMSGPRSNLGGSPPASGGPFSPPPQQSDANGPARSTSPPNVGSGTQQQGASGIIGQLPATRPSGMFSPLNNSLYRTLNSVTSGSQQGGGGGSPPASYGTPDDSDYMLHQQQQQQQHQFLRHQQQQQLQMQQQHQLQSHQLQQHSQLHRHQQPSSSPMSSPPPVQFNTSDSSSGQLPDRKQLEAQVEAQISSFGMLQQQHAQQQQQQQQQYYFQQQQLTLMQQQQYLEQQMNQRGNQGPATSNPSSRGQQQQQQQQQPMHSFAQLAAVAAGETDENIATAIAGGNDTSGSVTPANSPPATVKSEAVTPPPTGKRARSKSKKQLAAAAAAAAPVVSQKDRVAALKASVSVAASVSASDDDEEGDGKKQACVVCHHAKTSCDGQRPCSRCVRLGRVDQCEERPRKEHYKKRQKREREEAARRALEMSGKGGKNGGGKTAMPPPVVKKERVARAPKAAAAPSPPPPAPVAAPLLPTIPLLPALPSSQPILLTPPDTPLTPGLDLPLASPIGHPLSITSLPPSVPTTPNNPLTGMPMVGLGGMTIPSNMYRPDVSGMQPSGMGGPSSGMPGGPSHQSMVGLGHMTHLPMELQHMPRGMYTGMHESNPGQPPQHMIQMGPVGGVGHSHGHNAAMMASALFMGPSPPMMARRLSVPAGSPFLFSDGPGSVLGKEMDRPAPFSPKAVSFDAHRDMFLGGIGMGSMGGVGIGGAGPYRFDEVVFQQLLQQDNASMNISRMADRRNSAGQLLLENFPGVSRVQSPIQSPMQPTRPLSSPTPAPLPVSITGTAAAAIDAAAAATAASPSGVTISAVTDPAVPAASSPLDADASVRAAATPTPATSSVVEDAAVEICTDNLRVRNNQRRATYGPTHSIMRDAHLLSPHQALQSMFGAGAPVTARDFQNISESILDYYRDRSIVAKLRTQIERHQISSRRVQFFFAHMSEVLHEDEFREICRELPIPVFCSTKASFAHSGPPLLGTGKQAQITVGSTGSSSSGTPGSATSAGAPSEPDTPTSGNEQLLNILPYHFSWHDSPLISVNDDPVLLSGPGKAPSSGAVVATIQFRCVAGRMPMMEPAVDAAHLKTLKRKIAKRIERKLKAKQARSRKKERERRRKAKERSQQQQSKRPKIEGATDVVVEDEDEDMMESLAGSDHTSSSSSSSSGSDSDASDLEDLCSPTTGQYTSFAALGSIPHRPSPLASDTTSSNPINHDRIKKIHESSCKHFKRNAQISFTGPPPSQTGAPKPTTTVKITPAGGAAAATTAAAVSGAPATAAVAPGSGSSDTNGKKRKHGETASIEEDADDTTTCSCPRVIERQMTVHCNREWERLFGYTQAELRLMIMKEGARKTLARLTLFDAHNNIFVHSTEALLSGLNSYRVYSVVLNKWGCHIPCLVNTNLLQSEDGDLEAITNTWTVLPKNQQQK